MITHLELFPVGYCRGWEAVARRGGKWTRIRFPATVALLHWSDGRTWLWDTGYGRHLIQLYRRLPYRLQVELLPVVLPEEERLATQLARRGVKPSQIEYVVLSHFHGDHLGGLDELPPDTSLIYPERGWHAAQRDRTTVFHPGLMPKNFPRPYDEALRDEDAEPWETFERSWPLAEGMRAVELPGHAIGQIGLHIETRDQGTWFLVADAWWVAANRTTSPNWLGRRLQVKPREFARTSARLAALAEQNPDWKFVPSHCAETLASYGGSA